MVPVTFVVLHPGPVHTEIGSAFAVLWAIARIPKTARASNEFLRFENLGISVSLRGKRFLRFQAAALEIDLYVEACIAERCGASAALKKYQPDNPLGRVERVNKRGTCPALSKLWANTLYRLDLWKSSVFL
jgi:hypothetical protein